jgi:hypothetical protein
MSWKTAIVAALATLAGALIAVFVIVVITARTASATWKPEYANNPPAVQQWFHNAAPPVEGMARLGISRCCEQAERLMTKFVGRQGGDWSYYPDPNCTREGCRLLPIPADVVHNTEIHADNPDDDKLPEFDAMRREGVLFIWKGEPSCFWPPQGNDG